MAANFKFYDEQMQLKHSYNGLNKYIKLYFSSTNLPFIMKMNTHSTSYIRMIEKDSILV